MSFAWSISVLLPLLAYANPLASPLEARGATPGSALSKITAAQWNQLKSQVGGRLYTGTPVNAPCYWNLNGAQQTPNSGVCANIQNSKSNAAFLSGQFGAYQNSNWQGCQALGQSCQISYNAMANPFATYTTPCNQGSVPNMYIEVNSVSDVQAGLSFAKQNKIPLTIKNTGHDYKGRSAGKDSLALWMHNVKPAIKLTTNFKPDGCSNTVGDVITFGAGEQFDAIYSFAHQNKRVVVGGAASSVGAAGGWITGGGHSVLSNVLGLGVDNVQQLRAVRPDGTYITANRCQNTDMFFALRGGGGGAFGVVMEMSTTAHPETPLQQGIFSLGNLTPKQIGTLMNILVQNGDKWANEGFGGYFLPASSSSTVAFIELATSKLTLAQTQASLKPITDFVNSNTNRGWVTTIKTLNSFYDLYEASLSSPVQEPVNVGSAISSRLVPRKYFQGTSNQQKLASMLTDIATSGTQGKNLDILPLFINIVTPSSYSLPSSDLPGGPGEASVTPAWRTALWHVIATRTWDPINDAKAGVLDNFQRVHDVMQPLRAFTPDGGAYQNEADTYEPDPVGSFWGQAHYNRLMSIKKQYDPSNVLTCRQCIGWNPSDARWGCYPAVH